MRTKNSIRNSFFSLLTNCIMIFTNFLVQTIFIKILGNEYLGLNGLFTNIISMLSIVDLGIGSAIIYNLYKPFSENDEETIRSLINVYRKTYFIISGIIFLLGSILVPFLHFFVNDLTINVNVKFAFMLYVFDTSASYLMSYKRSLLIVDQKNYILSIIHIVILISLNIGQILVLYISNNYYVYILIRIIFHIIENIIITFYVNKKYHFINVGSIKELDKSLVIDIKKKIRALIFHKIGGFVISGTDNLIISKFLGIVVVGYYSNYYLIINAISVLFGQAINSIISSIGNLLVENNEDKNMQVFKRIRFIVFIISIYLSVFLVVFIEPFIAIWIGENYVLDSIVLYILVFNFFQNLMRYSFSVFKEAAGIYYKDRYVPIIESIINIVFSIIFVKVFGLFGVFLGTLVSSLVLWLYSYPVLVYCELLKGKIINYIKESLKYILVFLITIVTIVIISKTIVIKHLVFRFIVNILYCLIITSLSLYLFYHKSLEYKYSKKLINRLLNKCFFWKNKKVIYEKNN